MNSLEVALVEADDKVVDLVKRAAWGFDPTVRVLNVGLGDVVVASTTLVLVDAPARGCEGTDHLARHVRSCRTPIAVLTEVPTVDSALECLRLGARGYLSKHAPLPQLSSSLEHLLAGRVTLDPTLAGLVAHMVAHAPAMTWAGMAEGLTRREGEILDLLRRGLSNREIAERFTIGMQTVKSHAHRIYGKLGVDGRSGL